MNSKELRIGFYYLKNGSIFQMDTDTLSAVLSIGGEYKFEPLPLTNEWLLRLGCIENIYDRDIFHLPNSYYYIEFKNGIWESVVPDIEVYIKWVHQLQNLYYAITGQELTIKG